MKENSFIESFIESYTLKHEESFAIFDYYGNIDISKNNEEGIYYEGTRFLSYWKFYLFDKNPILLSSAVKEDNSPFNGRFNKSRHHKKWRNYNS